MNTFYVHIEPSAFDNRIKYVFNFIQQHPLAGDLVSFQFDRPNEHPTIGYGNNSEGQFIIPRQHLIFNTKPVRPEQLLANSYTHDELSIYSVELKNTDSKDFIIHNTFSFDLIETIFFHISRYEEHIIRPDMRANWGCGFKENHFIPRHQLQEIPVVDHLVYAFVRALGVQIGPRKTTYRLTHDIDIPQKFPNKLKLIKASARTLLIEKKGIKAQKELFKQYRLLKKGQAKDPYDTFDWLFREEGAEKAAYFMAGGVTKEDNFYQIESAEARRIISLAQERGYEIGLHPSYESYHREELFGREKRRLEEISGQEIKLSRQHFLRFTFPKTADIIENQGIKEDSSLGYRDMIGFRSGTGFGYQMYHFGEERAYHFAEMPLVVMEVGLLKMHDYDVQKAEKHLRQFLRKNANLTHLTLLFHNSIFDMVGADRAELETLYLSLVDRIRK